MPTILSFSLSRNCNRFVSCLFLYAAEEAEKKCFLRFAFPKKPQFLLKRYLCNYFFLIGEAALHLRKNLQFTTIVSMSIILLFVNI
jgi:hypothetical protein